ncbi:uncharacterized protein [Littorina saxatilis]|uniref:uncharacterized protein n=1 Tax=Littorina saxatilis TaxID=31220 RepID=UPI0038B48BBD
MGRYLDVLLLLTFFTLTAPIPAGILGGQNNCFRTSDNNLIITLEKDFKEGGFTVSAYGDYATVRQVEILTAATWDASKKSFLCYWKHEYASNCSLSEDGKKIILKLKLQLFDNYTVQLRDSSSAGEQKTANPIAFSCSDSFDEPKQTVAATPSSEWMPILSMVVSGFACILTLRSEIKWIFKQIRHEEIC